MDYETIMYQGKTYPLTDDAFERLMDTPLPIGASEAYKESIIYQLLAKSVHTTFVHLGGER